MQSDCDVHNCFLLMNFGVFQAPRILHGWLKYALRFSGQNSFHKQNIHKKSKKALRYLTDCCLLLL